MIKANRQDLVKNSKGPLRGFYRLRPSLRLRPATRRGRPEWRPKQRLIPSPPRPQCDHGELELVQHAVRALGIDLSTAVDLGDGVTGLLAASYCSRLPVVKLLLSFSDNGAKLTCPLAVAADRCRPPGTRGRRARAPRCRR